jgi:biotin-(acetyl-CoA carboxylase) ligase
LLQYLKKAKSLLEEEEKMDELTLINKIQKILKERYQQVGDTMVSGGVDNMEKYKYMLGQAHAYQFISGEISNLLNKGAKDGNAKVVDIRDERSPKA